MNKIPKVIPGDKVEVEWADHYASGGTGWARSENEDPHKPYLCATLGYVISQSPQYLLVAQTLNCYGEHSNVFGVVKSCITRMRKIK